MIGTLLLLGGGTLLLTKLAGPKTADATADANTGASTPYQGDPELRTLPSGVRFIGSGMVSLPMPDGRVITVSQFNSESMKYPTGGREVTFNADGITVTRSDGAIESFIEWQKRKVLAARRSF